MIDKTCESAEKVCFGSHRALVLLGQLDTKISSWDGLHSLPDLVCLLLAPYMLIKVMNFLQGLLSCLWDDPQSLDGSTRQSMATNF